MSDPCRNETFIGARRILLARATTNIELLRYVNETRGKGE